MATAAVRYVIGLGLDTVLRENTFGDRLAILAGARVQEVCKAADGVLRNIRQSRPVPEYLGQVGDLARQYPEFSQTYRKAVAARQRLSESLNFVQHIVYAIAIHILTYIGKLPKVERPALRDVPLICCTNIGRGEIEVVPWSEISASQVSQFLRLQIPGEEAYTFIWLQRNEQVLPGLPVVRDLHVSRCRTTGGPSGITPAQTRQILVELLCADADLHRLTIASSACEGWGTMENYGFALQEDDITYATTKQAARQRWQDTIRSNPLLNLEQSLIYWPAS